MADGVGAAHRAKAELPRHIVGTSHFLENLHAAAGPDDGDLLKGGQRPPRQRGPLGRDGKNDVGAVQTMSDRTTQLIAQALQQPLEIEGRR